MSRQPLKHTLSLLIALCSLRASWPVAAHNNESSRPTGSGLLQMVSQEHVSQLERQASNDNLPQLKVFKDIFRPDDMDNVDTYFQQIDKSGRMTMAQLEHLTLTTRVHSLVYADLYIHRYENYRELKKAAGPQVDQEVCLNQLKQLNARLRRLYAEKTDSRDTNLHQLLDTFEWYSAGSFLGGFVWTGSYNECLRLKINTTEGLAPTRYCSASIKRNKWPKAGKLNDLVGLKTSVCLPKACDSIQFKNKYALIENLVKFNARKVDHDDISLSYLYCLPDEDSSLRIWYHSPATAAFVMALILWLSMLIFATVKYEKFSQKSSLECAKTGGTAQESRQIKIYKSLSLIHNLKSLFQVSPTNKPQIGGEESTEKDKIVDFNVLEGIKVIAMCYVVTGHVLMCFTMIMSNGREMSAVKLSNLAFFAANLLPGLAVNSFFTITGILAAYLLFKNSEPMDMIRRPSKWFALVVYRYIRIMPLYLVAVMYTKFLGKYTGSGPLWDYGTSSLSPRRQCEQEPWFWTLTFTTNLKPPLEHCIPSAWYLANDFQFFLVTPIFLAILQKRPKLGKQLTLACILTGYILSMAHIALSNYDLRPLTSFMPHGFKTYVTFLSATYTMPHYRVPAYLCGLLIGFALYRYEQDMVEYLEAVKKCDGKMESPKKPELSRWARNYGSRLCLAVIALCFLLPFIGDFLQSNKFYSQFLVALTMPSLHLLCGLSTGIYILLATTGHGNKSLNDFLASPLWKPLSRLSLCVVLVNIEVISYFTQTSTHMLYMDFKTLSSLNLFSIVASYLVATVVCVTFESPLRASINHLVASVVKGLSSKQKSD